MTTKGPAPWHLPRFDWEEFPYQMLDDVLSHELTKSEGDYHLKVAIDPERMIEVYKKLADWVLEEVQADPEYYGFKKAD